MNTQSRNNLFYLLIVCYVLGSTIGNILVLRELLSSGGEQHQLTAEKKSRPIPDSPVGIIKTHILPVADFGLSIHVVPLHEIIPQTKSSRIKFHSEIRLIYSSLEFLPSKPRDPPQS